MKITTMNGRPSALPAVCAPVSAVASRRRPSSTLASVEGPGVWRLATADAPQLPQVHQVSSQSELAQAKVRAGESYRTNGFTVEGSESGGEQPVVVARGVPPRGRPV